MKINVISDLHIDFSNFKPSPPKNCDAIVIAGDISQQEKYTNEFIEENYIEFDKPIIWVMGNHESYAIDAKPINDGYKLLNNIDKSDNNIFLQNSTYEIGDYLFIGSTLWTDMTYNPSGDVDMVYNKMVASKSLNDYRYIYKEDDVLLTPDDTIDEFNKSFEFIKKTVDENKDKKIIIVSHHAPSYQSISPNYRFSSINHCFVSNLDDFILNNPNIVRFYHGHTHTKLDYTIGNCKVICNARGYTKLDDSPNFDQKFVDIL